MANGPQNGEDVCSHAERGNKDEFLGSQEKNY